MTPHRNLDLDARAARVVLAGRSRWLRSGPPPSMPHAIAGQSADERCRQSVGAGSLRKHGRVKLVLTEALGNRAALHPPDCSRSMTRLLDRYAAASLAGSARLGCSQDFADTSYLGSSHNSRSTTHSSTVELHIEGNGRARRSDRTRHAGIWRLRSGRRIGQQRRSWATMPLVLDRWARFFPRHGPTDPARRAGPRNASSRKRAISVAGASRQTLADRRCQPQVCGTVGRIARRPGLTARCALGNTPCTRRLGAAVRPSITRHRSQSRCKPPGERASAGVERLRAIIRDEIARHYRTN